MPEYDDLRDGYGSALIDSADARISAPELAAWTVASAAALAVSGVASDRVFRGVGCARADGRDREPHGPCTLPRPHSPRSRLYPACAATPPTAWCGRSALEVVAGDTVLVANLGRQRRTVTVDTPAGLHHTSTAAVSSASRSPRPLSITEDQTDHWMRLLQDRIREHACR